MTLPDICPRDGASHCKKNACHLYVVDWRSGDEQCIIGYRSTHKSLSRSSPVVDSYAQDTRRKRVDQGSQEPLGFYPKEKQITEVRHVYASRKPEVVSCEGTKPLCLQDAHTVDSCKGSDSRSSGEVRSWQHPDNHSVNTHKEPDFELREEVTVNTKNTTVIESREAPKEQPPKKRKSLDDVMNLDLPDNYEEEFWK
ncbi:hypothetical protein [Methanolobus sp.]|uniref:hypothetical protein n=1 Tax=Methanolobus sp. TaxID=1874737 RepID=UPI0025DBBDD7|nr:hypothetical protein [Methanolobus sp.]